MHCYALLSPVNCPVVICLPSMSCLFILKRTPLVNYGPWSNIYHWYIFHCYCLLSTNHHYLPHYTVNPLFIEQSYCLIYTLCLKLLSFACNLILEGVWMITWRWITSHRCSWMAVYVSCCIAQSNFIGSWMSSITLLCLAQSCQLPCCNLFTQHAMFVYLKENISSELWTPDQYLPLIHLPLLLFTFYKPLLPSTPYS